MTTKKPYKIYIVNALLVLAAFIIMKIFLANGIFNTYHERIMINIGINVILAVSLNLVTGFLGELALGHAGFMSIGAYGAALFSMSMDLPEFINFPVALLVGGIVASIFGILVGIPALRLRGDYLAIITLGFGEIIRVIIQNLSFTGGARGLKGIARYTDINYIFWVGVITVLVIANIIHSRHGRAITSIRENEIAAEASGIPTTYYKTFAFSVGAFFAGIAGGLYAHYNVILDPTAFDFNKSIEILIIVVLGGMGSLTGSIIAAIVLTALPEVLREFNSYRMVIYSVILIVVMIFKPSGLMGNVEFSTRKIFGFLQKKTSGGE